MNRLFVSAAALALAFVAGAFSMNLLQSPQPSVVTPVQLDTRTTGSVPSAPRNARNEKPRKKNRPARTGPGASPPPVAPPSAANRASGGGARSVDPAPIPAAGGGDENDDDDDGDDDDDDDDGDGDD
jgi:hypothetical protein